MTALYIFLIILAFVLAGYGTIFTIFYLDLKRDHKNRKTHQLENYWKQPIGQPFETRYP